MLLDADNAADEQPANYRWTVRAERGKDDEYRDGGAEEAAARAARAVGLAVPPHLHGAPRVLDARGAPCVAGPRRFDAKLSLPQRLLRSPANPAERCLHRVRVADVGT